MKLLDLVIYHLTINYINNMNRQLQRTNVGISNLEIMGREQQLNVIKLHNL